jgi:hypothetical protein
MISAQMLNYKAQNDIIRMLDQAIKKTEGSCLDLQSIHAKNEDSIQKLKIDISSKTQQVRNFESTKANLDTKISEQRLMIANLETSLQSLTVECSLLESQTASESVKFETSSAQLLKLSSEVDAVRTRVSFLSSSVTKQRESVSAIEAETNTLNHVKHELEEKLTSLQQEEECVKSEMKNSAAIFEDLLSQKQHLFKSLLTREESLDLLREELRVCASKCKSERESLEKEEAGLKKKEKEEEALQGAIQELQLYEAGMKMGKRGPGLMHRSDVTGLGATSNAPLVSADDSAFSEQLNETQESSVSYPLPSPKPVAGQKIPTTLTQPSSHQSASRVPKRKAEPTILSVYHHPTIQLVYRTSSGTSNRGRKQNNGEQLSTSKTPKAQQSTFHVARKRIIEAETGDEDELFSGQYL